MLWEYALVFMLISLTILIILAIPVLLNIRTTLSRLNKTLGTVNKDLPEIMVNVRDISKSLTGTTEKIKNAVDDIAELEKIVVKEIKDPLENIAQAVGMILRIGNKLFDRKKKK